MLSIMIGYGNSMLLATHGILAKSASGSAFDPDAQAFITAASITNPTQQSAINTLVTNLKGYNIWTKFKAIYPIVGGVASSHSVNLKTPGTYNLTFASGWTHSNTGMTPANTYANTFFNPSANATLNSHHLSYYSRTQSNGTEVEFGSIDSGTGNGSLIEIRTSGVTYLRVNNGAGTISFSDSDSRAFYIANRTASNVINGWRNSTKAVNSTLASSVLGIRPYYLGAFNNVGNPAFYTTKQCAFASIGDGLTDAEAANFYTAVQAYQTTLGRQV